MGWEFDAAVRVEGVAMRETGVRTLVLAGARVHYYQNSVMMKMSSELKHLRLAHRIIRRDVPPVDEFAKWIPMPPMPMHHQHVVVDACAHGRNRPAAAATKPER